MASVTFPVAFGGDGSTVTDDANATTGLFNGGHRTRFVASLAQAVAVMSGAVSQATTKANAAIDSANSAAASAASAVNSAVTNSTSTTSLTINSGAQSLVIQTNKNIVTGMAVMISNSANPSAQYMHGIVTSYTPATGALAVSVDYAFGTGTFAAWTVSLTAPIDISRAPLASPALTGTPTAPTATRGTSTNQLATMAALAAESTNGLANTQTISANLALSVYSPVLQRLSASAPVDVILPNATTETSGINILKLNNRGSTSIGVTDFSGGCLGYVRSGDMVGFNLADNSTPAGVWDAELNGAILDIADAAYSTPQATGVSNSTVYGKFHAAQLSASLGLVAYMNSGGGVSCVSIDLATGAIGTPNAATASGSAGMAFAIYPLTATTALLIYNNTSMVVVSVSGSTVSYATPVTLAGSYGLFTSAASGGVPNVIKLSATLFLTCGGWGSNPTVTAITISGTTITQATTAIAGIPEVWSAYYGWVALTATTALLTCTDAVSGGAPYTNRTLVVSVSSGTPTAGTPIARSVANASTSQPILPQSSTKALQLISSGTSYYARVLTISGSTVSAGAERTVRTDTSEGFFGAGTLKSSCTNPQAYSATAMAIEEGCFWTGGNSYMVLGKTDTVDILTADFSANTVSTPTSYALTGSNAMLSDTGYLMRFSNTATLLTITRAQLTASGLTPLSPTTLALRQATAMAPTVGKGVNWLVGSLPSTNQLGWTVTFNDSGVITGSVNYGSGNLATALRTGSSWAIGFTIGARNWAITNAIGTNNFVEVIRMK